MPALSSDFSPHADHITDIRNMFNLCLQPRTLYRPKNIDPDFIKSASQKKYSDLVELYLHHHGREAGFHSDVFSYFKPDVVIVSDGKYSDTSVTGRYAYYAQGVEVKSRSTEELERRYVLTTRKDGVIYIRVDNYGKEIIIK